MALGKAVAPEALDLLEGPLGKILRIAALDHSADELVVEVADTAGELEGRHRAAKLVGLGGGETRTDDRDLHRLLLEKRHAQGLFEHGAELGLGIFGLLLAFAAAKIGMDHVTLDRPGPHDRDLDHQIVEALRLDPRQHRHLRAALDLEDAQGVGLLDHAIDRRVIVLQIGHADRNSLMLVEQTEGAVHAAEHAEAEDIDLHEFEDVDIVLVPFDDLPVFHARGLDRDEIIEPLLRQHETAGMLRQMPRRANQLLRKIERQPQPMIVGVEVEARDLFVGDTVDRPAPDEAGEHLRQIARQTKRFPDLSDRTAGAIARDHGRQRGAMPPIGLVDPLDDFFAPFMLKIDVDIGRLLALARHETFEKQLMLDRVDRRHAEQEADAAVRRAPPPLA